VVAAFSAARLVADERYETRVVLDTVTMLALAYTIAVCLDGNAVLLAWSGVAVALARAADTFSDRIARAGAIGFLALVLGQVLIVDAPLSSLVDGFARPLGAVMGLVLAAGVAVVCARIEETRSAERSALLVVAAVAIVYLASGAIVTVFQPDPALVAGLHGGSREQGQALLSAFWGLSGMAALLVGLRSRIRSLRLGGLGLLCLAAAKVFLYDLAALGSVYRVASFVGLGVLLLSAAYVHQRLRATPLQPIVE
jgi:uncharacterized membrane protein